MLSTMGQEDKTLFRVAKKKIQVTLNGFQPWVKRIKHSTALRATLTGVF